MKRVLIKLLSLLSVFALVAAACGGDDDDSSSGSSSDSSSSSSSSSSDDGGAAEEASSGDLATCPDPLVIQTDWFPESEHGAMYELLVAALIQSMLRTLCVRYVA